MVIVGIAGSLIGHDPSVVILKDGEVLGGIEEERLSREKHRYGIFPRRGLSFMLKYHGLKEEDIDEVAYYWDQRPYLFRAAVSHIEVWGETKGCLGAIDWWNVLHYGSKDVFWRGRCVIGQFRRFIMWIIMWLTQQVRICRHLLRVVASAVIDGSGGFSLYHAVSLPEQSSGADQRDELPAFPGARLCSSDGIPWVSLQCGRMEGDGPGALWKS